LLLLKEVRGLPWSPKEGVTSAEQADRIAENLLRGVRPEAQTVHEQATAEEEKQAADEQSAAGPGGAGTTTVPVDASDTSSSSSSSSDDDIPAAPAAPTPVAADLLRTQPEKRELHTPRPTVAKAKASPSQGLRRPVQDTQDMSPDLGEKRQRTIDAILANITELEVCEEEIPPFTGGAGGVARPQAREQDD